MARSRTLKPEFWTDSRIVQLTPYARLFYQGCWNFSLCDHGHLDDDAMSLKLRILPADPVDPEELIAELIKFGRVVRKHAPDGTTYLHVPTLDKHTKMDTRWNTRCPYCALEGLSKPAGESTGSTNHAETRASSDEHAETRSSKGKESKGKSSSSASTSRSKPKRKIPDDFTVTQKMIEWARETTPLVGAAQTAQFIDWHTSKGSTMSDWDAAWRTWMRKAQADAERGNHSRASPTQGKSTAPDRIPPDQQCPEHRDQRAGSCRHCRAERLGGD